MQVERSQFVYTIERINEIFVDAESVNRANVLESVAGYLSCYLSYAFIRTHYEKVGRGARWRVARRPPLGTDTGTAKRGDRARAAPAMHGGQCMDVMGAFLDQQNREVYRPAGFEIKNPLRNGLQHV